MVSKSMAHWRSVGVIGGGQLGRMLIQAGQRLGLAMSVLCENEQEAAAQVTSDVILGTATSLEGLSRLAAKCDVLTLENEWVAPELLRQLTARFPVTIWPSAQTLTWIQDKYQQRQRLQQLGLPVPNFRAISTKQEIEEFGLQHGFPIMLKTRFQGYDGHGTQRLSSLAAVPEFNGEPLSLVEAYVPFSCELAVMVARTPSGLVKSYPVVETIQVKQVCHTVLAPAAISASLQQQAQALAEAAVSAVDAIGVIGVELFLSANGDLVINELAPRPHNSGHYTIEGCVTSQFEQHLRAILDWPLGDTSLLRPAAVMVNILGETNPEVMPDPRALLALADVHLHWYGKTIRPGRKVGHVTVLGEDLNATHARALQARSQLEV